MEITEIKRTIREIAENYNDNGEGGVFAYDNKLVVRPPYQREFVYVEKQRNAVIDTILKGFPLNVMYWSKNSDGTLEILDGQQRTISFCQFIIGEYSIPFGDDNDNYYFNSLPKDVQEKILNYELHIYICKGDASEKLNWFRTINIAGAKLTEQELRNATYTGSWLVDAKTRFSKTNCVASKVSEGLLKKATIRQELLETALKWISEGEISEYMSRHQFDDDANELWEYFNNVIDWVHNTFKNCKYKEMCNIEWGNLYNSYKDEKLDTDAIAEKVKKLMADEDVQSKKGIFYYVLDGNEKNLNLRQFRDCEKRTIYEKQGGICPICGKHYEFNEMDADHIVPWSKGGKTTIDNLQMLCKKCNHEKSNKY